MMENSLVKIISPYFPIFSNPEDQVLSWGWEWICDKNGTYLECSENVVAFIGYSATFLENKPLITGIIDNEAQKAVEIALKESSFPIEVQARMMPLEGDPVEVVLHFLGVRASNKGRNPQDQGIIGRTCLRFDNLEMKLEQLAEHGNSDLKICPKVDQAKKVESQFLQKGFSPKRYKHNNPQVLELSTDGTQQVSPHANKGRYKNSGKLSWMVLPLLIFFLFGFALFFERKGPSYSTEKVTYAFLGDSHIKKVNPAITDTDMECLVLFDSYGIEGPSIIDNMLYTLESMRVDFDAIDISEDKFPELGRYQAVVFAFTNLDNVSDQIASIMDWVEDGGKLLFAIRPDPSPTFTAIYRKLGIISKFDGFHNLSGVVFNGDLLPGATSIKLGEDFLNHTSLIVDLDPLSTVHVVSSTPNQVPLLWEFDLGNGRIVFINTDQFTTKEARGIVAAAYSLLFDVFAYPVINSSVFFIEHFPSPFPQGKDPLITQEFGRDLQSFYINVWWPDMQSLARRFGFKYTGAMLETYAEDVEPPFESQTDVAQFNYFGSSLLQSGGEIGYHGYNTVPLCLKGSGCNENLGYPYWPSEKAMLDSLVQMQKFSSELFSDLIFSTYVPPSNILSDLARNQLPEVLPGLKVISSTYLPESGGGMYVQEFEEAGDGIIEFPRITSGYFVDELSRWAALNELGMHYVQAHSVHPNNVLDEIHSNGELWGSIRNNLEDYFLWIASSSPKIRQMTAREGAMAVQRYARLDIDRMFEDGEYRIHQENYYDEGWYLLRTKLLPVGVAGGVIDPLGSDLFLIHAQNADMTIFFEE